jgi:hypothetical protein
MVDVQSARESAKIATAWSGGGRFVEGKTQVEGSKSLSTATTAEFKKAKNAAKLGVEKKKQQTQTQKAKYITLVCAPTSVRTPLMPISVSAHIFLWPGDIACCPCLQILYPLCGCSLYGAIYSL